MPLHVQCAPCLCKQEEDGTLCGWLVASLQKVLWMKQGNMTAVTESSLNHRQSFVSVFSISVYSMYVCVFLNVVNTTFILSTYKLKHSNILWQNTLNFPILHATNVCVCVCVCVCARACMHGQRFSLNSWRSMHINPLLTNYGTISLLLWITKEYYSLLLVNITFFSLLPLCARWSMYEQHQKLEARSWRGSERQCEVG